MRFSLLANVKKTLQHWVKLWTAQTSDLKLLNRQTREDSELALYDAMGGLRVRDRRTWPAKHCMYLFYPRFFVFCVVSRRPMWTLPSRQPHVSSM